MSNILTIIRIYLKYKNIGFHDLKKFYLLDSGYVLFIKRLEELKTDALICKLKKQSEYNLI